MFSYEYCEIFKNGFLQYPRWLLLNGSKNYSSTSFQYLKQHVWLFNKNNSTIKNLKLDDILSGQINNCIILLSLIVYYLFDSYPKSCYILQEKTYDKHMKKHIFSFTTIQGKSYLHELISRYYLFQVNIALVSLCLNLF